MKFKVYKLADLISTLENGGRPAGGVASITEGIPSIGGEHLTPNGGFNFAKLKYVPEAYFSKMKRGHIKHHDILIVKDGATTGKTSFVSESFPFNKSAVNEHVFIIRVKEELIKAKYLFYFLFCKEGQQQILANYRGAAIGGINQSFIQNVNIPIPSLAEQERIVNLLDEAEALRTVRLQASTRMADFVPALFEEMFGNPETNDRNWSTKTLKDLLLKIESGVSPVCLDRPAKLGEWGVLKLGAVTYCEYDSTKNKALPYGQTPRSDIEVKKGDVLFSRKNTQELVAACAFVFDTPPNLLLSDLIFRLRISNKEEILPEYLWQVMIQPNKRKSIQALATGAAAQMPNISKAKLLTVTIPVPPIMLQNEFVNALHKIRGIQSAQTQSEERIEALYQSMLSRAFTGQL